MGHDVRLLVCAGGTGGGVYPALSILQAVQARGDVSEVLWVGGEGGMEADLVKREGIPFRAIPAAGLHGVGLRRLPGNAYRLARGARAARRILVDFRPDVLLFTGGYVAVPVAFAGRHVPILLYVPDIEPGLALRTLARFADRICLIADESRRYFPGRENLVVTGHPVRAGLVEWTQAEARAALDLDPDQPVLLVFGGSKGARSINQAVLRILPELLAEVQVLHLTGRLDWKTVEDAAGLLPADLRRRYRPHAYLHERMGAAYASADVILSRAGASAVGEFPLFGKPALLVPYPHAWRYQKVNAAHLEDRGAALTLPDEALGERLLETLQAFFSDTERRKQMAQAMQDLARPDAAGRIASQLAELAQLTELAAGRKR